jgi:predicted TPR repeat methyltransferase
MAVKALVTGGVNKAFRPFGVQLVRGWSGDPAIQPFLSARRTIAAARRAGLSICDYVDQYSAEPGATAATVQAMLRLAELGDGVERVCEIGPGTGRYAEHVIAALKPRAYEVYETAVDWLPHLRELPNVRLMPTDGHSLSATDPDSVDLVHAQKVFVYLPLVVTVGYLWEMAQVAKPGGVVAFDVVTENCMDEAATSRWVTENAMLYSMTPRQWTIDLLDRSGLSFLGSAFTPLSGGRTELLAFRKRPG